MLHEGGTICELLHVHEWLYGEHPPLLASIGSQKSSLTTVIMTARVLRARGHEGHRRRLVRDYSHWLGAAASCSSSSRQSRAASSFMMSHLALPWVQLRSVCSDSVVYARKVNMNRTAASRGRRQKHITAYAVPAVPYPRVWYNI